MESNVGSEIDVKIIIRRKIKAIGKRTGIQEKEEEGITIRKEETLLKDKGKKKTEDHKDQLIASINLQMTGLKVDFESAKHNMNINNLDIEF